MISNTHSVFSKLVFFFWIILSASQELLIVYSDLSKSAIPSMLIDIKAIVNTPLISLFSCEFSLLKNEIAIHPNLLGIFDITNNLNSQFEVSKICEDYFLIHFQVSDSSIFPHKRAFSLISSKKSQNDAFIATLRYFNWTAGVAISGVEAFTNTQANLQNYSDKIKLFSISTDTFISDFIQKELMRLGSSLFYLFADKDESIKMQQSLKSSKMLTNGTGILLFGESSYGSTVDGALAIVEKGKETVDSYEKYLVTAISEIILLLSNVSSVDDSLILLSKKCPNHYCSNVFSLINIQKSKRKVVGTIIDGNLTISSSIVFLGNSSIIPKSQKKVLYFSANDGTTNPGASPSPLITLYKRGLTLLVNDINSNIDILQNFQLKLNDFDCGANVYNATFCYNCLNKDKDKLGLAHIVNAGSPVAYGEIATLAKLNITIPLVGAISVDPGLSNSSKYPFFTRLILPNTVTFAKFPMLLKVMGWNNMAMLYQNDSIGIISYSTICDAAAKQNINIVNKQTVIPPLLSREQIKNYTYIIQEIIDTNVRLILLAMNSPLIDYVAELFYDLGMRKGDIIFFSANLVWLTSVANSDNYTYKRVEVAVPLITTFQSLFIGEKGKKVHDDLYSAYGNTEPNSYACLYYDTGYLIGEALDWTINQGNDYTNPNILQAAIRNVKFTGCSGTVYMQKGANDVQLSSFTIQSNSYNSTTGKLKVYEYGIFTPTGSKVLVIENPFVYADGSTNKPTDFRILRTNCPFDDSLKQTFGKGRALVFGICFFVAAITVLITFFIWKNWWNTEVEELIKKEEISVSDIIVGATILVEFFQLLSQGPDIRPLNTFLANVGDAVSLDLQSFVKLENGIFWWIATLIIVLCVLWCIFCIEIFLRLDEKFNHVWFFRVLGIAADYSMPILGNLCFIPFISILLEIFVCDHSIGDNFTDSYLSVDCYQFCWQGNHIIYAVFSAISLVSYEPFAVFCRPLWQEFQHSLHVKSFPLYLMVKTVIQVILIVMNKTLKKSSDVAHGFVFTFLLLLYLAFFMKFKAYNYGRFNWWHKLSIIAVAWISLLSTINFLINGSTFPWIAIALAGWAVIILIGLAVQRKKYPSLLFRKEKDTSTLFKFAFTFGNKSRSHHSKIEPQKLDFFK